MGKQLTIESLFKLSSVAAPAAQPNGSKVIYVKTDILEADNVYTSQLFCYDIITKTTTQWTNTSGQNYAPIWSKDGNNLLFISTRTGKAQAYLLAATGGEALQLTDLENGISSAIWSPIQTDIFFTASIKDAGKEKTTNKLYETTEGKPSALTVDKMVYRTDTIGFFDTNAHKQIFKLTIANKAISQISTVATNHALSDVSVDGTKLLYSRKREIDNEKTFDTGIYEFDLITNTEKEITSLLEHASCSEAFYAPSGNMIAFIGSDQPVKSANVSSLFVYHQQSGELTNLMGASEMYVGDCGVGDFKQKNTTPTFRWYNDETLFVTTSHEGRVNIWQVDLASNLTAIVQGMEQVFDFELNHHANTLYFASSTPTSPNEIYALDLDTKKRQQLTSFNEQYLKAYNLSTYLEVEYQVNDGGRIHGFLAQPSDFDATKKYPLIMNIHGGPHAMHASTFFHEAQVMTAQGYAVLLLNPRGSHGYGQSHVNGVIGAYGEGDYTDLMTGLDCVLADYEWLDAEQLYVTGGSYGGFMTNWIVSHTNRFRSAVTQRSISNWVSFTGVSDIGYYFTEWEMDTDNFDLATMWKHSPLAYVKAIETPLLIIHSEEDYRCPMEQAEQLYTYLKILDQKTELLRFPKSSHELSRSGIPNLRIQRLHAIMDWFATNK